MEWGRPRKGDLARANTKLRSKVEPLMHTGGSARVSRTSKALSVHIIDTRQGRRDHQRSRGRSLQRREAQREPPGAGPEDPWAWAWLPPAGGPLGGSRVRPLRCRPGDTRPSTWLIPDDGSSGPVRSHDEITFNSETRDPGIGGLRQRWESGHFTVPACQGRRPGGGAGRLAMRPIMAHLTMSSAWAGSRSLSCPRRRHRTNHGRVRSTTQRRGNASKVCWTLGFFTISRATCSLCRAKSTSFPHVAAVRPALHDRGHPHPGPAQDQASAVAVLHVRRGDQHDQQQTGRADFRRGACGRWSSCPRHSRGIPWARCRRT
jgi:hypothetical protein